MAIEAVTQGKLASLQAPHGDTMRTVFNPGKAQKPGPVQTQKVAPNHKRLAGVSKYAFSKELPDGYVELKRTSGTADGPSRVAMTKEEFAHFSNQGVMTIPWSKARVQRNSPATTTETEPSLPEISPATTTETEPSLPEISPETTERTETSDDED
jgi:hypothetical protein